MHEEIREHLANTVYRLAEEVVCEGWALEMEYQLLKNWAQEIVVGHGGDWNLLCNTVAPRIHALLGVHL